MSTKAVTTWIAQHKVRTALLALAFIVLVWDWFAIPRLIIMMILPLVVLALPLLFLAAPIVVVVLILRRRSRAQQDQATIVIPDPAEAYPEATPQDAPRRLTQQELMDMYERYPERFEGVDFGDEIDR